MITFTLINGSVITLRASGTEPKIKYYIELKTDPGKKPEWVQPEKASYVASVCKMENLILVKQI